MQQDTRRAPRISAIEIGRIVFDDGRSSLDCVVRDLSATGARLRFASAIAPPERFGLLIRGEEKPVPCEMVWQRGMEAGVRFG